MSRPNPSMCWETRLNSDKDWSLGWIPTALQTSSHELGSSCGDPENFGRYIGIGISLRLGGTTIGSP